MRAIVIAIAGALVAVTVGTARPPPVSASAPSSRRRERTRNRHWRNASCVESSIFSGRFFDCHEDDPELGFRIDGLKGRLSPHVLAACRNEALASVGWDLGVCPDLEAARATTRSPPSLTSSSASPLEQADSQVLALYYCALNHPEDRTPLRTCQRQIGDSGTDFFSDKIKALVRCDLRVERGSSGHALGSEPSSDRRARLESRRGSAHDAAAPIATVAAVTTPTRVTSASSRRAPT